MKKSKLISIALCCMILLSAIIFHSLRLINSQKKAPSETWSKSLKVSEENIQSELVSCRMNENIISVFSKDKKIEILKFNEFGDISKKAVIAEGEDVRNIQVMNKMDNLKVMYTEWVGDERKLSLITLDKDLNILNKGEIFDVIEAEFLNEDKICVLKRKSIEVINWDGVIETKFESEKLKKIEVIESEGEYFMVALKDSGELLSTFYRVGDKSLKFEEFERVSLISFTNLNEIYLGEDEEQFYILLEMSNKSYYDGINMILYPKSKGEIIKSTLDLSKNVKMKDFIRINSKGEFLCSIERRVGRNRLEYDIARIDFKGTDIEEIEYITESISDNRYPENLGNTIVFKEKKDSKNINLALISQLDEVKNITNNKLNQNEKNYVFSEVFKYVLYSFIFSFLIGGFCIIVGLLVFIVITIYNDKTYVKKKKIRAFFIGCCLMLLFKNYEVYARFYVDGKSFMTGIMNNVIIGMGISIFISIITYISAYVGYKKDCESMPIMKFILWFIADIVLTMMFMYPYIMI